jgi:hypothetical protein
MGELENGGMKKTEKGKGKMENGLGFARGVS